jgi:hypothetical protein
MKAMCLKRRCPAVSALVVDKKQGLPAEYCSCCIMRVEPGKTVQPALVIPGREMLYYCQGGDGKVYIDGTIYPIRKAGAVLFEQARFNGPQFGDGEMKVACFSPRLPIWMSM